MAKVDANNDEDDYNNDVKRDGYCLLFTWKSTLSEHLINQNGSLDL